MNDKIDSAISVLIFTQLYHIIFKLVISLTYSELQSNAMYAPTPEKLEKIGIETNHY